VDKYVPVELLEVAPSGSMLKLMGWIDLYRLLLRTASIEVLEAYEYVDAPLHAL
jgi:hypothetical protein